jgi:hypothetical protein
MSVTLKLHARGTALCQDYEAMMQGVRRYIGWRHNPTLGQEFTDRGTGEKKMSGGWEKTGELVEKTFASVVLAHQYIHEIKHGALWAGDEETARLAGVKFDPSFGGDAEFLAKQVEKHKMPEAPPPPGMKAAAKAAPDADEDQPDADASHTEGK